MLGDFSAGVATVRAAKPGDTVAVLGLPGSGKTPMVQEAAKRWPRVVVFDPYATTDTRAKLKAPWPGERVGMVELLADPSRLDAARLSLVVGPDGALDERGLGRAFAVLAELCWHTGNLVLVGEEAGLYSRAANELVNRVGSGGGHVGVALVLIGQSFTRLHRDARRSLSRICHAAASTAEDLAELRKKCGADAATSVQTFKPGDGRWLLWRQGDVRAEAREES